MVVQILVTAVAQAQLALQTAHQLAGQTAAITVEAVDVQDSAMVVAQVIATHLVQEASLFPLLVRMAVERTAQVLAHQAVIILVVVAVHRVAQVVAAVIV